MPMINIDTLRAKSKNPKNGGPSFSLRNRISRVIWSATWLMFASWTPSFMWRWRIFLLKTFGAKISGRCDVKGSARVWLPSNLQMDDRAIIAGKVNCYNQALVRIGRQAVVSQGVHLCAGSHDIDDTNFQLITKPIIIGDFAWIAAESFVGPGSIVGVGAVLGARAVCFGKLAPWTVYVGNPCAPIRQRAQ